jgi:hypothetical protein
MKIIGLWNAAVDNTSRTGNVDTYPAIPQSLGESIGNRHAMGFPCARRKEKTKMATTPELKTKRKELGEQMGKILDTYSTDGVVNQDCTLSNDALKAKQAELKKLMDADDKVVTEIQKQTSTRRPGAIQWDA